MRRGILATETRTFEDFQAGFFAYAKQPKVRSVLEQHCEYLRDRLEESGLPSDRVRGWIRQLDGAWTPASADVTMGEIKPGMRYSSWFKRVEEMTEPLTIERAAADLLWHLGLMLSSIKDDKQLWHVGQVLRAYRHYSLSGSINVFASHGKLVTKARADGPKARHKSAQARRRLVLKSARRYWKENPSYRGDASNTAACIRDAVNGELLLRRLLPAGKSGLSAKTISDYIRPGRKRG